MQDLKNLRTKKRYSDGSSYVIETIDSDNFGLVENLIREFLLDHHDSEIGEMQGKIFAYEEIIKKSNFAPFVEDNHLKDILLNVQKAIAKYETEKVFENPFKEETKETTEEEIMFHSEFLQSDDFKNADCVYYYDLSGEFVIPNDGDKILKYYNHRIGGYNFIVVFIGKE